jgi:hypothetical protein
VYLNAYYAAYLGLCAGLILLLSWIFHRSGSVFLDDAFGGNRALVRAVTHLLDVGFYLVSIGYVGVSYRILWGPINSYGMVAEAVIGKLGGFLLLLGFAHLFNLLLLALFRKRGMTSTGAGATGTGVA